ncbi:MAG: hypothetical protein R3274_08585, partial [Desulfobacterales bacterium]|nr:hypothetical protein [Desulfobacterales bacterium]
WVPLNLDNPLATDEKTWDKLSVDFYGGDFDAALRLLETIDTEPDTRDHLLSLKAQLNNANQFKLKLNDYMSAPETITFNRTGNAEGVFVAAHDPAFNRKSVKKFLDAVIKRISEGVSDLSAEAQDIMNKVYQELDSIPLYDPGTPPDITISSDEVAQELDDARNLFELNEALSMNVSSDPPNTKPSPDPRPDIVQ